MEGQIKDFYASGINSLTEKNVSNALNSGVIIFKNKVQFVTLPFFFMVELQNFLYEKFVQAKLHKSCFLVQGFSCASFLHRIEHNYIPRKELACK